MSADRCRAAPSTRAGWSSERWRGTTKSPLSGFAVEFAWHREYVPGDDPKHIDWRVFFNHDKCFIKQSETETTFVCHLLLDVSASMRYGEGAQQKLLAAAQMAVTRAHCIVRQADKVPLLTFDEQAPAFLSPGEGAAAVPLR